MRALFINPEPVFADRKKYKPVSDMVKVMDVNPDDLHSLFKILDCGSIDIPLRTICGYRLRIVLDDEGLFRDPKFPAIFLHADGLDSPPAEIFYGRCLIFGPDDSEGNLTPLSDDALNELMCSVYAIFKGGDDFKARMLCLRVPVVY